MQGSANLANPGLPEFRLVRKNGAGQRQWHESNDDLQWTSPIRTAGEDCRSNEGRLQFFTAERFALIWVETHQQNEWRLADQNSTALSLWAQFKPMTYEPARLLRNMSITEVSMRTMKILACVLSIGATSLLLGCAVGSAPDEKNPPQLVDTALRKGWDGSNLENVAWDRPSAFGPVPANLQAKGDEICKKGKWERAVGYHPKALDLEGKPIPDGGFYCSDQKEQNQQ